MIEGEIDATEAAVVAAMLASDNVPDDNQAGTCFSCKAPMSGLFCAECGQKNDNYRRSIFSLVIEMVGSVMSLDSRIWRTWGNLLLRPGHVPREFSDGRRTHWSSPVRVYLAMSIILFGFMSVTNTHLLSLDINPAVKAGIDKPIDEITSEDIETKWKVRFFERQKDIDLRTKNLDFDLLDIWLSGTGRKIIDSGIEKIAENEEAMSDIASLPNVSVEPADPESKSRLPNITIMGEKVDDSTSRAMLLNFIKNPIELTRSFNTWLPRLMFIMMPFTMLLGALFIRDKKRAILFDHLVHSAYIHAFAFFLMFFGILASKMVAGTAVINVISIVLLIYLPLSLKRMFGRGWFKTLMTSYGVGFMYLLIVMIALTALIARDLSQSIVA